MSDHYMAARARARVAELKCAVDTVMRLEYADRTLQDAIDETDKIGSPNKGGNMPEGRRGRA